MYIAATNTTADEAVVMSWVMQAREAVICRTGRSIDSERLLAWAGNAINKMNEDGYTSKDIMDQLGLYAMGESGASLADFMTVLPCS